MRSRQVISNLIRTSRSIQIHRILRRIRINDQILPVLALITIFRSSPPFLQFSPCNICLPSRIQFCNRLDLHPLISISRFWKTQNFLKILTHNRSNSPGNGLLFLIITAKEIIKKEKPATNVIKKLLNKEDFQNKRHSKDIFLE